jgi:hemerythrin-like domain-containing protein
MSATTSLRKDHEIIEKVLKALEVTVSLFKEGNDINIDIMRDTADFITNFIDRCHHGKEEEGLFPALNECGLPKEQGPIAVMLMEHEEGRRLANMLSKAIEDYSKDPKYKDEIIKIAESYIALITHHIWKENNILFNLADMLLSDKAESINKRLDDIEEKKISKDEHEEYIKFVNKLG